MDFNEIKFQDAKTQTYLGSPSIVRLADGTLLATHDYFGKGCPLNYEHEEHLTSVYRSDNNGETWVNITHIANAFWSSLFIPQRQRLPTRHIAAIRLNCDPTQLRWRIYMDPPQRRKIWFTVPRRSFP